MHRLMERRMVV